MRRMIVVLVMSAMLLMTVFAVPAVGDMGDPDAGSKGEDYEEPGEVNCDWYGPFGYGNEAWWEYWCWYGAPWHEWYFVFWVWAD